MIQSKRTSPFFHCQLVMWLCHISSMSWLMVAFHPSHAQQWRSKKRISRSHLGETSNPCGFCFFENNSPKCERTILIQKQDPHGCPIVVRMQRMQGGQIVPESQTDVRQSEQPRNAATWSGCFCVVWIPCWKRSDASYLRSVGEIGKLHRRGPHLCASLPTENNRVNNKGENQEITMDKSRRKRFFLKSWQRSTECIIPVIKESPTWI